MISSSYKLIQQQFLTWVVKQFTIVWQKEVEEILLPQSVFSCTDAVQTALSLLERFELETL